MNERALEVDEQAVEVKKQTVEVNDQMEEVNEVIGGDDQGNEWSGGEERGC